MASPLCLAELPCDGAMLDFGAHYATRLAQCSARDIEIDTARRRTAPFWNTGRREPARTRGFSIASHGSLYRLARWTRRKDARRLARSIDEVVLESQLL